jgi:AcrR family transcriptional regulator
MPAHSSSSSTTPPQRSDARSNRDLILKAAERLFAFEGIDIPMDAVARSAGVGNATLYRHFPTRDALLEAVLSERYQEMARHAARLAAVDPPDEALAEWLGEFIRYAQTFDGLPQPILNTMRERDSALHASCLAMRTNAAHLLARAQEAGTIRPEVDATDLFAHASGIAWATQRAPADPRRAGRLLATVIDGIRVR